MGLGKAICYLRFYWASFPTTPRIGKPSRGLCALLPVAGLDGFTFLLLILFLYSVKDSRACLNQCLCLLHWKYAIYIVCMVYVCIRVCVCGFTHKVSLFIMLDTL